MNQKSCLICKAPFDFGNHELIVLENCSHEVCKECHYSNGDIFVCPFDENSAYILNPKNNNSHSSESTRKENNQKSFDLRDVNKSGRSDDNIIESNLVYSHEPGDFAHSFSINPELLQQYDEMANPVYRKQLTGGTEYQSGHRNSQSGMKIKPPSYCELHPNQVLDVICKNYKCQKYEC